MSNDGWPRCAVALLTTDKPDDNTRCLQALACCSLALLLFASDDTKIVEELLSKNQTPRLLFNISNSTMPNPRLFREYADFVSYFYTKTASLAGTAAALLSSSLARTTITASLS